MYSCVALKESMISEVTTNCSFFKEAANHTRQHIVPHRYMCTPAIRSQFLRRLEIECIVRMISKTVLIVYFVSSEIMFKIYRISMMYHFFKSLLTIEQPTLDCI
jgi:hypothetical protein